MGVHGAGDGRAVVASVTPPPHTGQQLPPILDLATVAREVLEQPELDRGQSNRLTVAGDGLALSVDHERPCAKQPYLNPLGRMTAEHGAQTQTELVRANRLRDEVVDEVIIDSFVVSILTAVLLWVMLQLIESLAHRVGEFFAAKPRRSAHIVGWISVLTILFSSKFLIIAAVGAVFGDSAVLGHFVEVILIVLTMMVARALVDQIFQLLGGVREPLRLSDLAETKPTTVHVDDGEVAGVG